MCGHKRFGRLRVSAAKGLQGRGEQADPIAGERSLSKLINQKK
jgi:hypothetical protein